MMSDFIPSLVVLLLWQLLGGLLASPIMGWLRKVLIF